MKIAVTTGINQIIFIACERYINGEQVGLGRYIACNVILLHVYSIHHDDWQSFIYIPDMMCIKLLSHVYMRSHEPTNVNAYTIIIGNYVYGLTVPNQQTNILLLQTSASHWLDSMASVHCDRVHVQHDTKPDRQWIWCSYEVSKLANFTNYIIYAYRYVNHLYI